MNLIKVVWLDAVGADGWITREDLEKEVPITHNSVGYLVKETDTFITITMSRDDKEESLGGWLLIPKKMILSIHDL
jgi:hypothetical protein